MIAAAKRSLHHRRAMRVVLLVVQLVLALVAGVTVEAAATSSATVQSDHQVVSAQPTSAYDLVSSTYDESGGLFSAQVKVNGRADHPGRSSRTAAQEGFVPVSGFVAAAKGGSRLIEGARYPLHPKIQRQLGPRGWTTDAIDEAVQSGQQVRAINKAAGNPATRHIHPTTGQSVVIDGVTGQVIHVGGPGFKYGPGSGDVP